MAVQLKRLSDLASGFNIPVPKPEVTFRIYRETLAQLPPDLLDLAVTRAQIDWKWGNRLPMPADILALVSQEFNERKMLLGKARIALRKAADEPAEKERGTFDPAAVDAILKRLGKNPYFENKLSPHT